MESTDTYCIHDQGIVWSSYRKLAWVAFEPTTTEFRSNDVTDWAIRPWVQLALTANSGQLLQFHCLFSVRFPFDYCLLQSRSFVKFKFSWHSQMNVTEGADMYSIRDWRIIWSSYRKLVWVAFVPTVSKYRLNSPTHWAINPQV